MTHENQQHLETLSVIETFATADPQFGPQLADREYPVQWGVTDTPRNRRASFIRLVINGRIRGEDDVTLVAFILVAFIAVNKSSLAVIQSQIDILTELNLQRDESLRAVQSAMTSALIPENSPLAQTVANELRSIDVATLEPLKHAAAAIRLRIESAMWMADVMSENAGE